VYLLQWLKISAGEQGNLHNDLTFFTNEPNATLLDRFRKTLKDAQFFDVLLLA